MAAMVRFDKLQLATSVSGESKPGVTVFTPEFSQALRDANFAVRVYRNLGAKIISVDVTPALHGDKPEILVDAPANINPPSLGRVHVTRRLPCIH